MSDNLLKVSQSDNSLIASNRVATSAAVISPKTKINSQSEIKNSTSIQSNANTPVSSSLISAICKTTTLLKSGVTTGVAHTTDPVYPPVVSDDPDTTPSKFIPKGPGGISTDPDTPVIPALPVQPTIKNVYGASIDIQNAKRILGTSNYNYIETDTDGFVLPTFTSNDIILGGVGTQGGIGDVDLNGAIRLAGPDRAGTINAIRNYAGVKNVYGASKDLENAEKILGDYGYNYIHTDAPNFKVSEFTSNDIIVGGTGAIGGIGSGIQLNGAIRLAGANEQLTAQAINNYNSPKYVYGNTIDIQNAENILGDTGYTYINTDNKNFHKSEAYASNDIILGGSTCTDITDDELNGAIRLAGITREDTASLVRNYSISKNVYGASIDLQNAKRILGTVGYNYIETDKSGFIMPKFTENDIILGGTGTIGGIGNVNETDATRLAGTDRTGTIQRIREYAGVKRVYGNSIDIQSARNVFGDTYFTYITVDKVTDELNSNDIVLGGISIDNKSGINGAMRLQGSNRALTGQTIFNYNTPKCVYGNKIDIDNARSILGDAGYDYIYTDRPGSQKPGSFSSNDIILGGPSCTGITDNELNDAIRLVGADRDGTVQAIKNYSTAINIYGTMADIDNVKGFLGTTGFNYIYTDKSGYIKIQGATYNDVLLGGSDVPGGVGDIPCVKENRLAGANRDLTAMAVWDHFGVKDIPSQSWGVVNRDPSKMYVNATVDGTGATISIAKETKMQIYGSDGDYYDCYYPGTNGVKILKLYLTKCDAPVQPSNTPGGTNYTQYSVTLSQALDKQMQQSPQVELNGRWVNASRDQVLKYLNPQNYRDGDYKYQFLDLSASAGISYSDMNNFLSNKGILAGKASSFLDACKKYCVSEVYAAAHASLETGNGTSTLATGVIVNGVKVYNMFGICAYDSDPVGAGSKFAYKMGWTTPEKAIEGGIEWISEQYINNATYKQNTLYKMRWNPNSPGCHEYATDVAWAVNQTSNIKKMYSNFPNANLKFDIPVYQ